MHNLHDIYNTVAHLWCSSFSSISCKENKVKKKGGAGLSRKSGNSYYYTLEKSSADHYSWFSFWDNLSIVLRLKTRSQSNTSMSVNSYHWKPFVKLQAEIFQWISDTLINMFALYFHWSLNKFEYSQLHFTCLAIPLTFCLIYLATDKCLKMAKEVDAVIWY